MSASRALPYDVQSLQHKVKFVSEPKEPPVLDLHLPDGLTEHDQWVLWRYEARNGRPSKVPYQIDGKRADSTDPFTWVAFEEALRAWRFNTRQYTGIGLVFSAE